MTTWTETIPVFAFFALLTFLPGWLVVRALGARGVASVAVSPIVTVTVLAVSTNLARLVGPSWSWLLVVVGTLGSQAPAGSSCTCSGARPRPHAHPAAPRPAAMGHRRRLHLGSVRARDVLPVVARPDEFVDSPDAVYHLEPDPALPRHRRLLDVEPVVLPQRVPRLGGDGHARCRPPIVAVTDVATIFLAAVVWPIRCVAACGTCCRRHGSSRMPRVGERGLRGLPDAPPRSVPVFCTYFVDVLLADLVELAHLHRVIEDRPATANARTGSAADDRHDRQIQLRCETAVQPQFLFAAVLPALQSGEIQGAGCEAF